MAIARQLTRSWTPQPIVVDDEKTLVRRGQAGDNDAFARLVERNQTGVYNLALRMTRDPEEAVDMTQETFLRAWRSLSGFRAEAKFSTWLYRIAYNVCLSRRIVHPSTFANPDAADSVPVPAGEEPPAMILRQERREWIVASMNRLTPAYRLVLDLYYWRDCTYEEIAAILDLPMGTVKTHLFRAKAALRTLLAAEGGAA
ncbi:MAG: sigma-70 family RNA polymerase sigma factor [Chloroflexota bacterium]|nr:sigma-70 family RNA polymerase sigma factor [Chloroflexota bacterium]